MINEWTPPSEIPNDIFDKLIEIADANNLKHSNDRKAPNYQFWTKGVNSFYGKIISLPVGSFYHLCKELNLI